MISREAKEIIEMLRISKEQNKGKKMTAESALEVRKMLDEMMGAKVVPQGITVEIVDEQGVKGEFLHYDETDSQKHEGHILLILHGGGFATGSVLSRRQLCAGILKHAKIDGFTVEYGQWPEAIHPVGLNDCLNGYRWLIKKGYSPEKIHVFGESAGAMLTLTMLLYLKDHGEQLPKNACVFSPVAGQGSVLESHVKREERDPMITAESVIPYFSQADFSDPYVSPRYGDFKGFPNLQIHVGSEEVLFDDSVLIEKLCKKAGVNVTLRVWEDMFHVFPLFPCPETEEAFGEIGQFLLED